MNLICNLKSISKKTPAQCDDIIEISIGTLVRLYTSKCVCVCVFLCAQVNLDAG